MAQVTATTAVQEGSSPAQLTMVLRNDLAGEFFAYDNTLLIRGDLPKARVLEIIGDRLEMIQGR